MIVSFLILLLSFVTNHAADKISSEIVNKNDKDTLSAVMLYLNTPALNIILSTPVQEISKLENISSEALFGVFQKLYPEFECIYRVPFEYNAWEKLEHVAEGAAPSKLERIIADHEAMGTIKGAFKHKEYVVCNCEEKRHALIELGSVAKNNYVAFGELPKGFNGKCAQLTGNAMALLHDGDIGNALAYLKNPAHVNNNHTCALYTTVDIDGQEGILYDQEILRLQGSMIKENPIVSISIDSNISMNTNSNEVINIVQKNKDGQEYATHLIPQKALSGKKLNNFILHAVSRLIQVENLRKALELNQHALQPERIACDGYTLTNKCMRRFYTTQPLVFKFKQDQQQKLKNALRYTMVNTIDTQLLSHNDALKFVMQKRKEQEETMMSFCTLIPPYITETLSYYIAQ
jgi:hypothetical protein